MAEELAGFREVEHTADWQLEVWAPEMEGLFAQAALGMNALSGLRMAEQRIERKLDLQSDDSESLLVKFLAELLYLSEQERLAFDSFDLNIKGTRLRARLRGGEIVEQKKEIKAVTFHNLAIRQEQRGLGVRIVFDV